MADITKFNNNDLDMNRYFYLLWALFISVLSCTLLNSCTDQDIEPIPVESVILNISSMELTEGDSKQIYATILPQNASNKNVIWTSSNSSVATVSDGVITALNAGKSIISVTTEDSGKTAICEVVVVAKIYNVESVTIDRTSVELFEGEDITLIASVMPENASNKDVVWSSSDETIATVEEGKVTTIKEGEVIVTVSTIDGNKTATCKLTVINDPMTDPIVFADPIIEGMCLDAFDTNNDGELSYKEAASVTDLTKMQLTNPGFVSFDEFQYFTSVRVIPERYFENHQSLKSITLPKSIEIIYDWAFDGTFIESISLPESVEVLGAGAFSSCVYLEEVTLSSNIQEIGRYCFSFCHNLTRINLPSTLISIGESAFFDCRSLKSIAIPESVEFIDSSAFVECCISEVYIDNIESWCRMKFVNNGSNPLYNANLYVNGEKITKLIIPEGVTSIGDRAFVNCLNITNVVIPKSLNHIGKDAFNYCNISNVSVEDLESWCKLTFDNDSSNPLCNASLCVNGEKIRSLIIPEGVTSICDRAFKNCISIESVTIPESVSVIGSDAFSNCNNLRDVYCKSPIPPVLNDVSSFTSYHSYCWTNFYVPYQSLELYKTSEIWSSYYNKGEWLQNPNFIGYDFENGVVIFD